MPRYVALFRGINVGKAKRIAMADLRALLEKLGFTGVQTLLNSGNALFTSAARTPGALGERIRAAVAKKLDVDAQVIVKSAQDVAAIVAGNRLEKIATDPARMLIAMTADARALAGVKSLAKSAWGDEKVHVGTHAAYIWCPNGILASPAAQALLAGLANGGTTRNWDTLRKIHALLTTRGTDGS